jgi:hypothetical protein
VTPAKPNAREILAMTAEEAAARGAEELASALLTPNPQLRAEWAGLVQTWFALAQYKAIRERDSAAG